MQLLPYSATENIFFTIYYLRVGEEELPPIAKTEEVKIKLISINNTQIFQWSGAHTRKKKKFIK